MGAQGGQMTRKRPPSSRRGEQAIRALQEADSLDAMTRLDPGDDVVYTAGAEKAHAKGEALLEPERPVAVSAGEAVSWGDRRHPAYQAR